jgi:hypothetical protein
MPTKARMTKPRWSELVAAFGLDQPFTETGERSASANDRPSVLSRGTATRAPRSDSATDPVEELTPSNADVDVVDVDVVDIDVVDVDLGVVDGGEEDGGEDEVGPEHFEADNVLDRLIVEGSERFGALLLSDAAEMEAIPERQEIRRAPAGGDDRFAELGSHIAQAMRVAYDAVGEMKRLEQQIAALLAMQDGFRETLVEAADELHRSLASLSLGDP